MILLLARLISSYEKRKNYVNASEAHICPVEKSQSVGQSFQKTRRVLIEVGTVIDVYSKKTLSWHDKSGWATHLCLFRYCLICGQPFFNKAITPDVPKTNNKDTFMKIGIERCCFEKRMMTARRR